MSSGANLVLSQMPNWFWGPYGFLLILNVVLSGLVLLFSWFMLRASFPVKKIIILWTIFSLGVPLIAPLFFILYTYILKTCLHKKNKINYSSESYPEFEFEKDSQITHYGEGGAVAQLNHAFVPDSVKLQSLIRLNHHNTTGINKINESMLQNDFDELRLYAYSMLDKQETELYNKIHSLEEQLKTAEAGKTTFMLYKALSYYYWELIYLNLAQDDIKKFAIEKTELYLEKALEIDSEGLSILLLHARLKLLKGDSEAARELFKKTFSLGAPEGKVVPYLAEIAYKDRDFKAVKACFARCSSLSYIPQLNACAKFWEET